MVVTVKYVVFVPDAGNHGEGGNLALITRMRLHRSDQPADKILLAAGHCGSALIFGDGIGHRRRGLSRGDRRRGGLCRLGPFWENSHTIRL